MILKGNQRGGGQQLATHLMNSFDNERVEVAEVRRAIARDLSGAFAEWSAVARGTKCTKDFYSLSLNPDQSQRRLTRAEYLELLDRTERSLNLVGQPRAVVFHEKRDKDGNLREHCHAVWSRIDSDRMIAVPISHDRLKLRTVIREFCRDHGLELPDGMKKGAKKDHDTTPETLAEKQQQERTGITRTERRADIAACWKESGGGAAFVQALEKKGYFLAQGGRRVFVVVDLNGEVHSLARQIEGVRAKDIKARLSGYPLDKLPDVEAARAYAKKEREERQKTQTKEPSDIEQRRHALKIHQQARRATIDTMRLNLIGRHMSEREGLKALHESDNTGVATARLKKQPKGIMAFLQRVTGLKLLAEVRQQRQDKARAAEHKQQAETLGRTHGRELADMDRRYRALSRLEEKEIRSADMALKREHFQQLVRMPPARALKPEFDRALQNRQASTGTEGKSPDIDLKEAFNRQVDNRLSRDERDRDNDGPDRGFDPKRRN
jgi:hypothetical protein